MKCNHYLLHIIIMASEVQNCFPGVMVLEAFMPVKFEQTIGNQEQLLESFKPDREMKKCLCELNIYGKTMVNLAVKVHDEEDHWVKAIDRQI
jgi:hypothetical protein